MSGTILDLLNTEVFKTILDIIYVIIFIAVFSSLISEAVKGSYKGIFKIKNKVVNWFSHLFIVSIISGLVLGYISTEGTLKNIFLMSVIFIGAWGLSYHTYIFILKWLMILANIVSNILAKLKMQSELDALKVSSELDILKGTDNEK